ncbi:hypothetical protein [Hyalangium gracile]|uniref:hypothetical protein n=1 Tax=Hyalangium gracile TaxID=394092 RepID=UPI001CCC2E4A|nr:hypothetical protein [Hyalangium gracile]
MTVALAWACGESEKPIQPFADPPEEPQVPETPNPGNPPDPVNPNPGNPPDPVIPDPGNPPDPVIPDPGNPPPLAGPGPWPNEPIVNYTQRYNLGRVRSVGVDDAYNIWLLDGERIGVLRPGDTQPRWVSNIGQARLGFGPDKLALGSTVICGGSAGRAYVGYSAPDLSPAFIYSPDGRSHPNYDDPDPTRFDPVRYEEYQKGDLDAVKLTEDGSIVLEEHLQKSARPNGPQNVGIRNTNDHHFDEDRTVLSCTKVMHGQHKGELYIGTNHGVTRIRGLVYNSHRHPIWYKPKVDDQGNVVGKTQMTGLSYALGIGLNGDVLIGNDWNVGVVAPSPNLADWDKVDDSLNLERLSTYVPQVNSQEEFDYWRGFQQTKDGSYYLGSRDFGLWQLNIVRKSDGRGVKVAGLPTDSVLSLAATEDGSLFIGTGGGGLWRMDAQKQLSKVNGVAGSTVKELRYDPTVSPAMLYVLTDAGLTVLRGH